jgi:hypothetical protein
MTGALPTPEELAAARLYDPGRPTPKSSSTTSGSASPTSPSSLACGRAWPVAACSCARATASVRW